MNKGNKFKVLAITMLASVVSLSSYVSAAPNNEADKTFNKTFGNGLFSTTISIPSLIALFFQFLLGVSLVYTVYRAGRAGIKISSDNDGEKKTEGLKNLGSAMIGMLVTFSSYGVVNTVRKTVIGNDQDITVEFPCTGYNSNTNQIETGKRNGEECDSVLNDNVKLDVNFTPQDNS